jgi:hypothetical protein
MINGRRQPSRDGTSRMNREVQVRICERLRVQFPGPTRQSHRFSSDLSSAWALYPQHPNAHYLRQLEERH